MCSLWEGVLCVEGRRRWGGGGGGGDGGLGGGIAFEPVPNSHWLRDVYVM